MKELIERNYESTRNRGLITSDTDDDDFVEKIEEELKELRKAITEPGGHWKYELADIILVCLNYGYHSGLDMEQVLKNKVTFNEMRND